MTSKDRRSKSPVLKLPETPLRSCSAGYRFRALLAQVGLVVSLPFGGHLVVRAADHSDEWGAAMWRKSCIRGIKKETQPCEKVHQAPTFRQQDKSSAFVADTDLPAATVIFCPCLGDVLPVLVAEL